MNVSAPHFPSSDVDSGGSPVVITSARAADSAKTTINEPAHEPVSTSFLRTTQCLPSYNLSQL